MAWGGAPTPHAIEAVAEHGHDISRARQSPAHSRARRARRPRARDDARPRAARPPPRSRRVRAGVPRRRAAPARRRLLVATTTFGRGPGEPPARGATRAFFGRGAEEVDDPIGEPLDVYRATAVRLDRELSQVAALLAALSTRVLERVLVSVRACRPCTGPATGSSREPRREGGDRDGRRIGHRPGDGAGLRRRGDHGASSPTSTKPAATRRSGSCTTRGHRVLRALRRHGAALDRGDGGRRPRAEYGGVDIVHNNAGLVCGGPLWPDITPETLLRVMAVNLGGVVLGTRLAIPAMQRRGGGAIVNTASMAALYPMTEDPIYSATKAGVTMFTRACAPLAEEGIRVNAVLPGLWSTRRCCPKSGDGERWADWAYIGAGLHGPDRPVRCRRRGARPRPRRRRRRARSASSARCRHGVSRGRDASRDPHAEPGRAPQPGARRRAGARRPRAATTRCRCATCAGACAGRARHDLPVLLVEGPSARRVPGRDVEGAWRDRLDARPLDAARPPPTACAERHRACHARRADASPSAPPALVTASRVAGPGRARVPGRDHGDHGPRCSPGAMGDVDREPPASASPSPCARCGSRGCSDWVNGWNDAETVTRARSTAPSSCSSTDAPPAATCAAKSEPVLLRPMARRRRSELSTHTIEFPYTRTLGPVFGTFLTGLRDGQILGIRSRDGQGARARRPSGTRATGEALDPTSSRSAPAASSRRGRG